MNICGVSILFRGQGLNQCLSDGIGQVQVDRSVGGEHLCMGEFALQKSPSHTTYAQRSTLLLYTHNEQESWSPASVSSQVGRAQGRA